MDLRYSLAGLVVGFLIGFSGIGGGSLMTPLLILLFKINPLIAVGTDLLYNAPTKLLGAIVHSRQKTVNWRLVGFLAAGGIGGALIALIALFFARQHLDVRSLDRAIRHAVGIAVIGSAVLILVAPFFRPSKNREATLAALSVRAKLIAIGVLVGVVVTITSIGAGAVTLPLLLLMFPSIEAQILVGSDVAFGAVIVPVAAAGHWSLGTINLAICGMLLIGSLPGVYIGSRVSKVLPLKYLRPALAGVLILAGSRLI